MADILRMERTLPWREAAKDSYDLRPMLLDQFRHEDLRQKIILDVGTGEGRLAFVAAALGARVVGVDLDHARLMHARAYAGIRNFRRTQFVWGDVEKTPYQEWSPVPYDYVVSNLCMSPTIVWRAAHALRRGGKLILCCHHGDHWRETGRGSKWAFFEDAMADLLEENRLTVEFMGVDRTVVTFEGLREVELYLRDSTVRKWVSDGRWEELSDSFARGTRTLTESYLVVKARRMDAPPPTHPGAGG